MAIIIREAAEADFGAIWNIFHPIVKAGTTYAFNPDTTKDEAFNLWMNQPRRTFVAEENGEILGTYYIKANQAGPGSHIANCGYMVGKNAQGKGIATKMCEHSQEVALLLGFKGMQFNSVVSTNTRAVALWKSLGFETIGTLPKAFEHPQDGYVDAHVMFKWLAT